MKAIAEFERQLVELIGKPTELRPFVCDGSPLDCEAFIVGFNPATTMSVDFWQFWCPGYGFDKDGWFEAYKKDRMNSPLKPGKTRRNPVSNTRRFIEWVLAETSPIRCLETNIYSAPTKKAADLAPIKRVTTPFEFLLDRIRPRVVVVHGKDAAKLIQTKQLKARIIEVSHFSRGWSEERARELGRDIKKACE